MNAKPTVLVVDDEVSIRTLLRDYLSIMKYDVTVAANVEAARAAAHRQDALICDIRLQGQDGTELARELVAADPDMAVLLVSGEQQNVDRLPQDFDFLLKPFSLVELNDRLKTLLAARSPN